MFGIVDFCGIFGFLWYFFTLVEFLDFCGIFFTLVEFLDFCGIF